MFSNTFAGIAPSSVPGFIAFQVVGVVIAFGAIKILFPDMAGVADEVVVPHAEAVERAVVTEAEGLAMPHLLVIGGSDAGISASLRVRELDPSGDVTMVVADAYPNFSICGIPFYVSGETPDWHQLAHRTREEIEATGLELRLDTRALEVDVEARTVLLRGPGGAEERVPYDRLVIGTGAVPIEPPIEGIHRDGVHLLRTMDDTFALQERLADARSAVIVGGGYIGLEMADALTHRGIEVTLLEQAPAVMTTVDVELGELIGAELAKHDVRVRTDALVRGDRTVGRSTRGVRHGVRRCLG